eukprot:gene2634-3036_t
MSVDSASSDVHIRTEIVEGIIEQEVPEPKPVSLVPDYKKDFNDMFFSITPLDKTPLAILKVNAYSGALSRSTLRGLSWRGMHELLAPILYLLHNELEAYTKLDTELTLVDTIYDSKYLENDVYTLFYALMTRAANWFGVTVHTNQSPLSTSGSSKPKHTFNLDSPVEQPNDEPTARVVNEAVEKCKNINFLLRQKDSELHSHLESLGIEPQIYLFSNQLFGENPLASPNPQVFTPFSSLMGDSTPPMTNKPSSFPSTPTTSSQQPVKQQSQTAPNTPLFFGEALFSTPINKQPVVTTSKTSPKNISSSDLFSEKTPLVKDGDSLTSFFTTSVNLNTARSNYFNKRATINLPKSSYITTKSAGPTQEVKRLQNIQRYLGNTLGDIIPTLQTGFSENENLINHDALILAVAQVKQIKDMLLGDLPLPELIPDYDFESEEGEADDPLSKR